jgi:hypothetical protein
MSPELMFHAGLLQPLLLNGFNAAVDLRVERLVLTYSHGEGLELPDGVELPFTTGGGAGLTLYKELYVLGDLKVHRYELPQDRYTTLTVGAELGYRLPVWKGLTVTPVVRYWPNVWNNAPADLEPIEQGWHGLFANVLVGWAFDLPR